MFSKLYRYYSKGLGQHGETLLSIKQKYLDNVPIVALTAFDSLSGLWVEKSCAVDICLVGDSLAQSALGMDNTYRLTLDEMIHHSKAVSRVVSTPLLVADLPFGTYERDPVKAVNSVIKLVKEGRAQAVKLEGGKEEAEVVRHIVGLGVPVLGHIGLHPQKINKFGGFKTQGTDCLSAIDILEDAICLEKAGCFGVVIEAVTSKITKEITSKINIPTIGIGSGRHCSGQIMVISDILQLGNKFETRFSKSYASICEIAVDAIKSYGMEVKEAKYPEPKHEYKIKKEEYEKFQEFLQSTKR